MPRTHINADEGLSTCHYLLMSDALSIASCRCRRWQQVVFGQTAVAEEQSQVGGHLRPPSTLTGHL